MRIYLASSWRNDQQPVVLAQLRSAGHEAYDFKNPGADNHGFSWKQIDPNYSKDAIPDRYSSSHSTEWLRQMLAHPIAEAGFKCDFDAMKWATCCVLLLPSGMSAHLEAGWFAGAGKPVAVLAPEIHEPELMYKMFDMPDGWAARGHYAIPLSKSETPIFESVGEVIVHLRKMQ